VNDDDNDNKNKVALLNVQTSVFFFLLYSEIHCTGIPCEKLQLRFTEHWEIVGLEESIKIV
jgi:hypothetical protein